MRDQERNSSSQAFPVVILPKRMLINQLQPRFTSRITFSFKWDHTIPSQAASKVCGGSNVTRDSQLVEPGIDGFPGALLSLFPRRPVSPGYLSWYMDTNGVQNITHRTARGVFIIISSVITGKIG